MGKTLNLGPRLKYPITISKLIKKPGDTIAKQEKILEYKFTWTQMVGDGYGEEWEEKQTSFATWDCPSEGTLKQWKVHEGMTIASNMAFAEIEEACPHSIQFQGMCGMCGKDMTETTWASQQNDTERAKINMIHDQTGLTVSVDEATRAEGNLQRRLLQNRKLSLVVDLDQTIIHACIEPTVGEWQKDPTSPNYEAVKDVRSFQLNDDGSSRGITSGAWYYIKMRPGLKEFLNKVAEMYELHIYTMGTRAYAMNIAKIVDPTKRLFGDRIISRDENGSITSKSLSRLFPVDTKMVVVIDDRSDVWPRDRAHLIKVVPYDFFLGIGDINSSFLPKREDMPIVSPKKKHTQKIEAKDESEKIETPNGEVLKETIVELEVSKSEAAVPKRAIPPSQPVKTGGGDDLETQEAEQEKFLEKQLTERPLLHMQEKLDQEDEAEDSMMEELEDGQPVPAHSHHRHNLLKDDDVELLHLEKHLTKVHTAFYDDYDSALVNAQGGRVAQLKPGHNRKLSLKTDTADLKVVPDVAVVMPRIKSETLDGCTLVLSGLVPLQAQIMRTEIGMQADSFGAKIQTKVNRHVTHVVAQSSNTRTHKVRQGAKYPHIKIVNSQWLFNSMSKWEKEPEEPYLVKIHDSDRIREDGFDSSAPSMESDDSEDTESENEDSNSIPASQDDEVAEGVIPDEMEAGHSPIDDLKEFDWGEVDDELKDFLGSDSDNDSDSSNASNSSSKSGSSNKSASKGTKRQHQDITDDDDSDEESALAKKQRTANQRSSGLKTVKTSNSILSESSLPTPGGTGDEDGDEQAAIASVATAEDGDNDSFDDMEADLMAEFDRDSDAEAGDDGAD